MTGHVAPFFLRVTVTSVNLGLFEFYHFDLQSNVWKPRCLKQLRQSQVCCVCCVMCVKCAVNAVRSVRCALCAVWCALCPVCSALCPVCGVCCAVCGVVWWLCRSISFDKVEDKTCKTHAFCHPAPLPDHARWQCGNLALRRALLRALVLESRARPGIWRGTSSSSGHGASGNTGGLQFGWCAKHVNNAGALRWGRSGQTPHADRNEEKHDGFPFPATKITNLVRTKREKTCLSSRVNTNTNRKHTWRRCENACLNVSISSKANVFLWPKRRTNSARISFSSPNHEFELFFNMLCCWFSSHRHEVDHVFSMNFRHHHPKTCEDPFAQKRNPCVKLVRDGSHVGTWWRWSGENAVETAVGERDCWKSGSLGDQLATCERWGQREARTTPCKTNPQHLAGTSGFVPPQVAKVGPKTWRRVERSACREFWCTVNGCQGRWYPRSKSPRGLVPCLLVRRIWQQHGRGRVLRVTKKSSSFVERSKDVRASEPARVSMKQEVETGDGFVPKHQQKRK